MSTYTFRGLLPMLALAATSFAVPAAWADAYNFDISGSGITASGVLYVAPTDTPGTLVVTGISGNFTDGNVGFSGAITGLEPTVAPSSPPPFSAPAFTAAGFSYDNLFYPDGSPLVCADYPFSGGVFDSYGVAFDVAGGYTAEMWSDGVIPGAGLTYAVGDSLGTTQLEPNVHGAGIPVDVATSPVPEPNTLALLGTGLVGLGSAFRRRLRPEI